MKIFACLLSIVFATAVANAQDVLLDFGSRSSPPDLPAWTSVFPEIPHCTKMRASESDNQTGKIYRLLEYVPTYPDLLDPSNDLCSSIQLELSYSFSPPPPPKLTKAEHKEQKRLQQRTRKSVKKLRKLDKLMASFFPQAAAPRPFKYKSYVATEHFAPPSDYLPSPRFVTVEIKFAAGRQLTTTVQRNFEQVIAILDQIDFEALNSSITKWLDDREKEKK